MKAIVTYYSIHTGDVIMSDIVTLTESFLDSLEDVPENLWYRIVLCHH